MPIPLTQNERIEKTYQEVLNTKAKTSTLAYEVEKLKQNHFQKYLPSYVSITALLTSFLLGYLASRWAFKSQVELEDIKKVKESEFKQIDIETKKEEAKADLYADATKYQKSYTILVRTYYRLRIRYAFLAGRIKNFPAGNEERKQQLVLQLEEVKNNIHESNTNFLEEFKHYTAAVAKYNYLKKGNTLVNQHLQDLAKGISFSPSHNFDTLTETEELNSLYYSERRRFLEFWKTHIQGPSADAIEHILKNT